MSSSFGVILFIVAILVTILIHEAAHFGFAKLFRIKVEEFFVGFGPRLWSTRRGETEYGVKALPLGGYVRIAGMNPFEETAQNSDAVFAGHAALASGTGAVGGDVLCFAAAKSVDEILKLFGRRCVPFAMGVSSFS